MTAGVGRTFVNTSLLMHRAWNLYRLARTPAEFASVTSFIGRYVGSRLASHDPGSLEVSLLVQGVEHRVGLAGGDAFIVEEVYLQRCYSQLPDFLARPGWTVVDAGANTGVFCLQQAARGAHVLAFEPNPTPFRRLSEAVVSNNFGDRVTTFNCGLGSVPGLAKLSIPNGFTAQGHILDDADSNGADAISINLVTLDHVISELGSARVDLLKVDVEGAETEVLKGASRVLTLVDRIVLEYHSERLLDQVLAIVADHGFGVALRKPGWPGAPQGILYLTRLPAIAAS